MARAATYALYPDVYEGVLEIGALAQGQNHLLGTWDALMQAARDNTFVELADMQGLEAMETLLGLVPETSSLYLRRQQILAQLRMKPPFTMLFLQRYLRTFSDDFTLRLYPDDYTLELQISLEDPLQRETLARALAELLPANILVRTLSRIPQPAIHIRMTPVCGSAAMVRHLHKQAREVS